MTHADLIERLQAGDGEDPDLFMEVAVACGVWGTVFPPELARWALARAWLEFCRALQAEVLPGWRKDVHEFIGLWRVALMTVASGGALEIGEHPTSEERAWAIAILRAREAGHG